MVQDQNQVEASPLDLYALIANTVAGTLQLKDFQAKINELDHVNSDTLVDVLTQFEVETNFVNKGQRDTWLKLTKLLAKDELILASTCIERFDIDTLIPLQFIEDKKSFITAFNRLRTRLYFKQRKFNLLREESEGFARLLTALFNLNSANCRQVLDTVKIIIGDCRIDPNRVLDILLEVFEFDPTSDCTIYTNFLREYYDEPYKITQLIILKLSFYTNNKNESIHIPQSLYRLIANLIHDEIIDLGDIYSYLMPSDEKILDYHRKLVKEGESIAKRYAVSVMNDEKSSLTRSVTDDLNDEDRFMLEIDDQKRNLCAHLIGIGDWEQGLDIVHRLPEFYCFSDKRVAISACDLIEYLIDPLYRGCALTKLLISRMSPASPRRTSIKQVTNVNELAERVFPMLYSLGPFLSASPLLLTKLIRILRHALISKQDGQTLANSKNPLFYKILDVIDISILPSMSLTGGNCCIVRELWTLIEVLKCHTRYKLYSNWHYEGSNPIMLRNKGQILLGTKHHMKRLSKGTLRFTGRHLGKLCYSNPTIALNYILVQIQSYDNLITLVIDALRFLPPIGQDVLMYCIIEILSDPRKDKKSFDGMNLAPWLTSLSNFFSSAILKYKIDITGFLEYITNQLKAGSSLDLVLLTDLILKMTGIETMQAITDDRIEALMGGDILRTEGAYFNQVKNTRKSSARLKDALIESRLAMPLCILIAQLRDSLFFNQQDETPLKLVGKLYDQCQETLVQYGVFLSMNLSIDDYINFLPPLDKLLTEYKLDPDSAFFLARPMIFHKIKSHFLELKEKATQEIPAEEGESPELSPQSLRIKFVEAARSIIDPITVAIRPSLMEKYGFGDINAKLLVIFWTLSMSDIEVPVNSYEKEIQRLKSTSAELGKVDDPKRRKEKERCNNLIQKLKQEQAEQIEHTEYVKMYLESEKNNLFGESTRQDRIYLESKQFIQHCPFARSTLSPSDAIYSARFLFYLHELKVQDYSTIICLDRILCDLTSMMGACTENEANHFGRFMCRILKIITHWHSDNGIYSEECEQYPGSIINSENLTPLGYEDYREICFKWQYRMTKAFTVALESNNYIQIRNALIVMTSIIDYYPAIKHFGKGIGMKIEEVRNNEKENRQDLYALATAYAGRLDDKKNSLIPEANFHTVPDARTSTSSRPSSNTSSHRERHSSSSSRKKARHS